MANMRRKMAKDGYENRLKWLELTHRELDQKISTLTKQGYDEEQIRIMKIRKLKLKDQIANIVRDIKQ